MGCLKSVQTLNLSDCDLIDSVSQKSIGNIQDCFVEMGPVLKNLDTLILEETNLNPQYITSSLLYFPNLKVLRMSMASRAAKNGFMVN